eukprot:TRINITY_DN18001_c0_g1_i1.p1 TRINITY_DN18001_c0_g1~~TRINITY_DN18001_c0_g1_i1.p1  ORF type:complete len:157 (+),score=32.71 TRINITY_DN18001_c0_g1_i1:138-608(+)
MLNSNYEEDDEKSTDEKIIQKVEFKKRIKAATVIKHLDWDQIDSREEQIASGVPVCDIIIGSELTYTGNEAHARCLVNVIDLFLTKEGFFLEILSDDRDGVSTFLDLMKEKQFVLEVLPVPHKYQGNFATKQRPESYKLYAFKRVNQSGQNFLGEL